jgi:hypothetical protein
VRRLMTMFCFFSVLFAMQAANSSKIYKCVSDDGKVVFSDAQCAGSPEVIQYHHPEAPLDKIKRELAEARERRAAQALEFEVQQRQRAVDNAQRAAARAEECRSRYMQNGLEIGMTQSSLLADSLWQYPDDVSKTTTSNGVTEYWVFRACEGYGSVRLYITKGRLTSIHN